MGATVIVYYYYTIIFSTTLCDPCHYINIWQQNTRKVYYFIR